MSGYTIPNYSEKELYATIARYPKLMKKEHFGAIRAGELVLVGIRNDVAPLKSNGNVDQENDKLFLMRKESNGSLSIVKRYDNFNTDPSQAYLDEPINDSGTAILVPSTISGVGYDYEIGTHTGSLSGIGQPALVQDYGGYLSRVWRRTNKLEYGEGQIFTGRFDINFHNDFGNPHGRKVSAGCQSMPDEDKLDMLRRIENNQSKIKYFLLNASTVNQTLSKGLNNNSQQEESSQNSGGYRNGNNNYPSSSNLEVTQEQLLVYEKAIQALVFFMQNAHAYRNSNYEEKWKVENVYNTLLGKISKNKRGIHVLANMIYNSDNFQNGISLSQNEMLKLCKAMAVLSRGLMNSEQIEKLTGVSGYVQPKGGEAIYSHEIRNGLTSSINKALPAWTMLREIPSPEEVQHILLNNSFQSNLPNNNQNLKRRIA